VVATWGQLLASALLADTEAYVAVLLHDSGIGSDNRSGANHVDSCPGGRGLRVISHYKRRSTIGGDGQFVVGMQLRAGNPKQALVGKQFHHVGSMRLHALKDQEFINSLLEFGTGHLLATEKFFL